MGNVLSKRSLYDILSTVLTGYILCISTKHGLLSNISPTELLTVVATFPRKIAVAFIVGMVFHKIIGFVYSRFISTSYVSYAMP